MTRHSAVEDLTTGRIVRWPGLRSACRRGRRTAQRVIGGIVQVQKRVPISKPANTYARHPSRIGSERTPFEQRLQNRDGVTQKLFIFTDHGSYPLVENLGYSSQRERDTDSDL